LVAVKAVTVLYQPFLVVALHMLVVAVAVCTEHHLQILNLAQVAQVVVVTAVILALVFLELLAQVVAEVVDIGQRHLVLLAVVRVVLVLLF
jgi:hypothetical protein